MKITQRGPTDADLSQHIQNDKLASQIRRETGSKAQQSGESAKVNISIEARELQRIAELVRTGDELRAQKVNHIKEQITKGNYNPDAQEVSKSIVRSEISRILENK
jgi:flagellar biosynthesis anti-sigma factor FlgM